MSNKKKPSRKRTDGPILEPVHESAAGLHRIGPADDATISAFDTLCLTPHDPDSAQQMDTARRIMRQRRAALHELAK